MEDPKAGADIKQDLPDILVLQIRHFNSGQLANPTRPGWFFQTYAPLSALLSMWNGAPASRDRNELELFKNKFEGGGKNRKLWIATIEFQNETKGCLEQPLSWKLSKSEKTCVNDAWKTMDKENSTTDGLLCVHDYLTRTVQGGEISKHCQLK
jgi:hypothetical protein